MKIGEKHMKKKTTIALIAHDMKKHDIVKWALDNKELLEQFDLCGTGTTASLISEATGLKIKKYLSGPLGGDQQIGAKIAEKKIDLVIFFWDPLNSQPHDPDVKALLRIAVVYDIPIATNPATANYVLSSSLLKLESR
jgi:methylglyoxal synthase